MKNLWIAILLSLLSFQSSAILFEFSIDDPNGGIAAGDIKNVSAAFDTNTEVFTWQFTIENYGGTDPNYQFANSFWLVVSDGPNPKGVTGQLAIFYGDVATGDLVAYEYNGVNGNNSFADNPTIIDFWGNALTVDDNNNIRTVGFSVDVSQVNNYAPGNPAPWEGARFDDLLGVWFHAAQYGINFSSAPGDPSGTIESYAYSITEKSYYDAFDQVTDSSGAGISSISEPNSGSIIIISALLLVLVSVRKRINQNRMLKQFGLL